MSDKIETPLEAKQDALVCDINAHIVIDKEWTYEKAEELMAKKEAWLDNTMRSILPPSVYDKLHAADDKSRAEAAGYLDREGIRFKEINQCAFITVKDKIVARCDTAWRMTPNGKRKSDEQ